MGADTIDILGQLAVEWRADLNLRVIPARQSPLLLTLYVLNSIFAISASDLPN